MITALELKEAKSRGFLPNKDGIHFSARVLTENGVLNAEQFKVLSEAANKFGNGKLALTVRMTLEIQGVKYEDIDNLALYLKQADLEIGGTGAKVRPVVACKGTVCPLGNVDTQKLAEDIHNQFYEGYKNVTLPHKFKIGIGGCPNNCIKPDLNDLGIIAINKPVFDKEKCRGCKKCNIEDICPMKACNIADGILNIDKEKCNDCGICVDKCLFGAIPDGEPGFIITLGGKWGKKTRIGDHLNKIFTADEINTLIEKVILLYKEQGNAGERFADLIERLTIENAENILVSDEILNRKSEILGYGMPV